MGKLYLITGAAGHLGSAVTARLRELGRRVRALVLPDEKNPPAGAELCRGDVCDKASMSEFFSNPNADELIVVHCAGIVSIASKFDPRVRRVNVEGTKNVVDMCAQNNVKKLVYISSVHALPELARGETISETRAFDPEAVVGLYAKTKAEATAYVLRAAENGLDASVVHPSGICGPYDPGRNHLTALVQDYCARKLTAGVRGGYDFVDVRDVAAGVVSCCDRGARGECYILSNRWYSVRELLDKLRSVTGGRPVRAMLPIWLAKAAAPFAETYYRLRKKPPLFTKYSLYTLSSNAVFSHKKADAALGYTVRPLEDTLRDTVDWLKTHDALPLPRRLRRRQAAASC